MKKPGIATIPIMHEKRSYLSKHPGINGHFDPKSLSIAESLDHSAWKSKMHSLYNLDEFGLRDSVLGLDKFRKLSRNVSVGEFIADLTNKHEQLHFKDYVSSELGILLTFVFQLRADVVHSYIRTQNEELLSYFPVYNTIVNSLYGCDLTQQQAVDALNLFYRHEFSGVNYDIFKTDTPEAPCSPGPLFCFNNILEASAILSEIAQILAINDEDGVKALELIRVEERDPELYFGLISFLFTEIPCHSAIAILIRYCLDSRVPIIGSPLNRTINWHDFHPGFRLLSFTKALKEILLAKGLDLVRLSKLGFEAEYHIRLQEKFLDYTHYAGRQLGKLDMWDNDHVASYEITGETLLSKMSERAQKKTRLNFHLWDIILNHIYASHAIYKKARSQNPLMFYSDIIVGASDLEIAEMNNWTSNAHAYALFTIIDGNVGSVHENPDWIKAFIRKVQIEVDEMFMDRISAPDIHDQLTTKYKMIGPPFVQEMYTIALKKMIGQYYGL